MAKQKPPVKKNEIIELAFEDLTHEGAGVGKIAGYPLFVPYALPGEKAKVKIVKVNKNFGFGKLLEVQEASPERVEPPCAVYIPCGGCQLQHMSYDMQLDMKRKQVQNVMRKIARMDDVPVHPTIGMEDPWRYRNKIQIPVGEKNGELITGFYQRRTHNIIEDMETCVIQEEFSDRMTGAVRRIADRLGISAYDEEKHAGVLRHIMVRTGHSTGETMIVLVTKTDTLPEQEKLIKELHDTYPKVTSIIQNVNKKKTNVIFGEKTKVLWGNEYIYDNIGDIKFAISARSFYQVNPEQTKHLYDTALDYAGLTGGETVIDAYSGIGTISLFLAQKAKKVYGVEIIPEAVADAKENARINYLDNAEFFVGKAEKIMPWWTAQGLRPEVIVVDPPRKGCEEELLEAMLTMQPERIVYVSCNPSTLARDLKILADGGYQTKQIQPVDMFPQTNHIECCALVEKAVV